LLGTLITYNPALDEVFAAYGGVLPPNGYRGFPYQGYPTC